MNIQALSYLLAIASVFPFVLFEANAQEISDYELVSNRLDETFLQQRVILYPVIDQRKIAIDKDVSASKGTSLWALFVKTLERYPNLTISRPSASRDTLKRGLTGNQELVTAKALAEKGRKAYTEVRLRDATQLLTNALERLLNLDYHVVDSKYVGQLALLVGLAHLENKRPRESQEMFETALLIHPKLRLKKGYDHPKAIVTFERVRLTFKQRTNLVPPRFGTFQRIPRNATLVKSRLTHRFLELLIVSERGVQTYRQPLTKNPVDDSSRLASQLFACLPRGHSPRPQAAAELYLDTGFNSFFFASSPLAIFPHTGISTSAGLLLFKRLSLEGNVTVSASGRDAQEHLRSDITTLRMRLAGGVNGRSGRLSGFAHLGLQVDRQSEVIITTNVACKYFSPEDNVPPILCNFESDMSRTGPTWSVGPSVSIGGRVRLLASLYLIARLNAASYVYSSNENDLDWPLGGSISLGYRLF